MADLEAFYSRDGDNRFVHVRQNSGFSEGTRDALRGVSSGASWDVRSRTWSYPYKPGVVIGLREAAGALGLRLSLDRILDQIEKTLVAETEREWEIRKVIQAYMDDPKLEVKPYTTGDPKPWRHQQLAWHWGMRVSSLYLQHKMGLGKTRSSSDIIRGKYEARLVQPPQMTELRERQSRAMPDRRLPSRWGTAHGVLIVCPSGVITEWVQQLWRWQKIRALAIVGTAERKRKRAGTPAWVHICSYDSLEAVEDNEYDGIVADELHCIANDDSNRFARMWILRERSRWAIGLSGTPQSNGLESLWAQYYFLDGGRTLCSTFKAFKKRFFAKDGWAASQLLSPEDAVAQAIARISWPLSMQQAFPDKPQKIHQTIRVPLTAEQVRYYERVRAEALAEIKTGRLTLTDTLTRITKLFQIAQGFVFDDDKVVHRFSSAKLDALEEMLTGKGDLAEHRTIVWCNFRPEASMISEMLTKHGIKHLTLKGGLSHTERATIKDAWNNDHTYRVCLGTINMGIGLNLHAPTCVDNQGRSAKAFTTVFFGWNERVTAIEQAMDRVYRGDQTETCVYRYIMTEGFESESEGEGEPVELIDTKVYNRLMMKIEKATRVDESSLEYIRYLLGDV
jgi:SNF2 family DNA or RNA helicase